MKTEISGNLVRALGWVLAGLGVLVSWAWSTELAIAGRPAEEAIAGACAFALLAGGIALLYRTRTLRARPVRVAYLVVVGVCLAAALTAATAPFVATRTSTGSVTTTISPIGSSSEFRLSRAANLSSDTYGRTALAITVHADDRTAPLLLATVSFSDGTPDISCANTRSVWTHEISTVTLGCSSFTPVASLRSISAVTVREK